MSIIEYTFRRISSYDIFCDESFNDIHSIFYKGIDIKNVGRKVVIEIISKINLNLDIISINSIKEKQNDIKTIIKIMDIFECEQNFYIIWEDFLNNSIQKIPLDLSDKMIEKIFKSLQEILIFVVDNNLLIDSIKYDDIFYNKDTNDIKILLRPQKKKKEIIYGSPIYSPHQRRKVNGITNLENHIINISILMYELIIKKINTEFNVKTYPNNLINEIINSDSIFSDFLQKLFDDKMNVETRYNFIKDIQNIKNSEQNVKDKLDFDIFNFEL